MRNVAALAVGMAIWSGGALADRCTKVEEIQAVGVVPYLNTWQNVHLAFQQFAHCDDGAVAEGYSEMVVRLMVEHWGQLSQFRKLSHAEPRFEAFVLNKINATVDPKDLDKLHDLAKSKCASGNTAVCRKIVARVEASWKDQ